MEKKKTKKIIILSVLAVILVAFSALGAVGFSYYSNEVNGVNRSETGGVFEVSEGLGFATLAAQLKEDGYIQDELCFKIYLKLNPPQDTLKAGRFELKRNMSYAEIIAKLCSKPIQEVYTIRVTEGLYQDKILETISKQSGYTAEELLAGLDAIKDNYSFLKNLPAREKYYEGYIYPDTYEFFVTDGPEKIMKKFLDNFEAKLEQAGVYELLKGNRFTLDEAVTLASIIQCETPYPSEMRGVAAVFTNRLDINMKLQSDVTVYYALGKYGKDLTLEDLAFESPYSTYYCHGLPKGPIANVRIEAIVAALTPEEHDYLFFIFADGRTIYAKDFDEHVDNCNKYLK